MFKKFIILFLLFFINSCSYSYSYRIYRLKVMPNKNTKTVKIYKRTVEFDHDTYGVEIMITFSKSGNIALIEVRNNYDERIKINRKNVFLSINGNSRTLYDSSVYISSRTRVDDFSFSSIYYDVDISDIYYSNISNRSIRSYGNYLNSRVVYSETNTVIEKMEEIVTVPPHSKTVIGAFKIQLPNSIITSLMPPFLYPDISEQYTYDDSPYILTFYITYNHGFYEYNSEITLYIDYLRNVIYSETDEECIIDYMRRHKMKIKNRHNIPINKYINRNMFFSIEVEEPEDLYKFYQER